MDFILTDEQSLLRATVRAFAEREIRPHVMQWDEAQEFPTAVFRAMGEAGKGGMEDCCDSGHE